MALAPGAYDSPALSPDGRQIALVVRDNTGAHLWVYDIVRGTLGKRTFDGSDNNFPIWSRDGAFLAFSSSSTLSRVRADGSGPDVVVRDTEGVFHATLTTGASDREARFAPARQWLAYRSCSTTRRR